MRCSAKIEETLLFPPSKEACSSPLSQQMHKADTQVVSLTLEELNTLNYCPPKH